MKKATMMKEKKRENFLRKLLSLSSLINNHNITFKDFSIIIGDKKINIPHEYIVKEVDGLVDIEIKNANWGSGYIRTVLNVVGDYNVDVFKNEDSITINRINPKDDNGCIVVVDYIMYDKTIGYSNMHYLYILKNDNK